MTKKRIYEVAKELGVDNKVVVQKAKDLGFDVKNHMSSLEDSAIKQLKSSFQNTAPGKSSENGSAKQSKIKISVSSIRKNEKKSYQKRPNKKSTDGGHTNTNRRNNNHQNRQRSNQNGRPKAAAQNLLAQFKQKQRAEESSLNEQIKQTKKEYHEQLKNHKQDTPSKAKEVKNNQKSEKKHAPKKAETRTIGPKILKPSPARFNKNKKAEDTRSNTKGPKRANTHSQSISNVAATQAQPQKEERRNGC